MIVRNGLKQGYPFIEAIASALPICDEFLVSDGYSTDGTYEVLQKLPALNKKIVLSQDKWPNTGLMALSEVSNILRWKCKGKHLLYMQAAEVIHEDNLNVLASLPEIYPDAETFCFPYVTVIGNYKIMDEARLRFCKNLPWLAATGDAWALSVTKKFVRAEARRNLKSPKKFLNLIGRGVEWRFASSMNNTRSRMIYLPKEIIRYPALFRNNYVERCRGHIEYFSLPEFKTFIEQVEGMSDEDFVQRAVAMNLNRYPTFNAHYKGDFATIKAEDHPKIMHELLASKQKSYYIRDSIIEKIANS
jgi:glycosyltransferase involved in cell wall biosynthesis